MLLFRGYGFLGFPLSFFLPLGIREVTSLPSTPCHPSLFFFRYYRIGPQSVVGEDGRSRNQVQYCEEIGQSYPGKVEDGVNGDKGCHVERDDIDERDRWRYLVVRHVQ